MTEGSNCENDTIDDSLFLSVSYIGEGLNPPLQLEIVSAYEFQYLPY